MYQDRIELYKQLGEAFDSEVLLYVTGDRKNMETQIASDVIDCFIKQLDAIGTCKKISLYLYTRGGETAAAWNIINLIRMFADNLQVIVPNKAHSAGTIISLGANEIVMTKQATLSPIDPSINTPLNPPIPNITETMPVSVEAVKGYLEFAREELKIEDDVALANIFMKLTESVHPLVLGQVYRSKSQIQMLAKKLLVNQVEDEKQIANIIDFLCSESGSHDYTINRREAKDELCLKVIKPTSDQYTIIKNIYEDISQELQLTSAFNVNEINGAYVARRCLLESVKGGSDYFATEGQILRAKLPNGQVAIQKAISFEGWRHENSTISEISIDSNEEQEIKYERSED